MRFAVKVVPTVVLGCAAALLVACGDGNGLLSSSQASGLQDALATAQSACADGQAARAQLAAQRFSDRVVALPPGEVDRRLIADLQDGAAKLDALVASGCTGSTTTPTTPTVPTNTLPTTTETTTPTEPTTTTETTTETTPPPATIPPATTPPDTGGGATPPGDSGGASPETSSLPPGLAKKGNTKPEKEKK